MTNLVLERAGGRMRKISINVLNEDSKYTLFTFPVTDIGLQAEQLDAMLGFGTFRSWYNQRSDGVWEPMTFWQHRKNGDYPVTDEFRCEKAIIVVSGDQELVFEPPERDEDEDDADEEDKVPAAKISDVVFKPTVGGITLLSFHVQVRPGVGTQKNQLLQEHMYRAILVSLLDTKAIERKARENQQQFPFEGGASAQAQGDTAAQPEAAGEAQPRNPVLTPEEAAAAGITDETDAALDKQLHRPGQFESRGGAAIDADMAARREQREKTGPDSPPAPTPEELKRFEENAATQVAAFNAKPGEVIDGRSERVKNQDRRRSSREH